MALADIYSLGRQAVNYLTGCEEPSPQPLNKICVAAFFALYPSVEPESRITFNDKEVYFQRPIMLKNPLTGEEVNVQGAKRRGQGKGRLEVGRLVNDLEVFLNRQELNQLPNNDIAIFIVKGMKAYRRLYPETHSSHKALKYLGRLIKIEHGLRKRDKVPEAAIKEVQEAAQETQKAPPVMEVKHSYFYEQIEHILAKKEDWEARRDAFISFLGVIQNK